MDTTREEDKELLKLKAEVESAKKNVLEKRAKLTELKRQVDEADESFLESWNSLSQCEHRLLKYELRVQG